MRFHRLRLTNYRGVTDAEVEFPEAGVTIVEGDNEVGKSSLCEAIDLVLAERDDSSKRQVRAVKPVDRDVGAEVELELSTGPYRLRYRKRWHRQKETVLELLAPERAQLTGREAHDRVQAILDETLDAPLWGALRLRQGQTLAQAAFAGGSLGRALDLASGGESAGGHEDDLWDRITAERDRYWTPTGQQKVERATAERRVNECRARVEQLETELLALEREAEEVERLDRRHRELAGKRTENVAVLAELQEQHGAIERLRREVERLTERRDTARAQHERSVDAERHRRDLVERATGAAAAVAELEERERSTGPARAEAEARRQAAQEAFDAAERAARDAEAAHRRAVADRDHRRQEIELAQLAERHARVRAATSRRAEATAVLEANHVDEVVVERIDAAHVALVQAEAAAVSGAATVDAQALADLVLEVDGIAVELATGDRHELTVTDPMRIDLPGVVRLRVQAGPEARSRAEQLGVARERFAAVCTEAGVDGLTEARQAAASRAEAERVVAGATASIAQDLRDLTFDELAHKVEGLTKRTAAFTAERPVEPPLPPDLDAAQAAALESERALDDARGRLERLRGQRDDAARSVQDADVGDARAKAHLESARGTLDQAEATLAAARAATIDEDVERAVADAAAALEVCSAELVDAETRLAAADPTSVEVRLENARGVQQRLDAELRDVDITRRDLRTKLAVQGEEGLAHELDVARTELERLALDHERLEGRAAAARRLHEAFAARRVEAHHRYVAPFRERIEQLGRLVFGADLEVDLDDDLRVARRTLDGVTLDFDHLSTGAQEQLGIISRLACASIVAPAGGAPVVFDDALGWTDPRRLERMGAVIATAGRDCQVIVLTCTPGRYESVGHATVVRLPS